ncbi:MAG: hypothetical protein M1819_004574 [Sarea resinae]|nr:MAG: hypothetical protein M1819_004574 [Sarea resinae]
MAQPSHRTFSFDYHDDGPPQHYAEDDEHEPYPQRYRDSPSPTRGLQITPPPLNASPPPRTAAVSPLSSTYSSKPSIYRQASYRRQEDSRANGRGPTYGGPVRKQEPDAQQLDRYNSFSGLDHNAPTHPEESFQQEPRRAYMPPASSTWAPSTMAKAIPAQPRKPLPTVPLYSTDSQAPPPPPHTYTKILPQDREPDDDGRYWGRELGYSTSTRTASTTTPGMDNLGDGAAGGGINGIATGVANRNERESGLQALRDIGIINPTRAFGTPSDVHMDPAEREFDPIDSDSPYAPRPLSHGSRNRESYSSNVPLGAAATAPALASPPLPSPTNRLSDPMSQHSDTSQGHFINDGTAHYADHPYARYTSMWDPRVGQAGSGIDPEDIADDGEDGLQEEPSQRKSILSLGKATDSSKSLGAGHVAGGAVASGVAGSLGGIFGVKRLVSGSGARNTQSGQYGLVPGTDSPRYNNSDGNLEKSEWLNHQNSGNKRLKWLVGIFVAVVLIAAIVGGAVGGVLGSRKSSSSSGQASSSTKNTNNGYLNADSPAIKSLMNNTALHKVFPGMDYTPMNAQYPACLTNPANQNNVTKDVAVLSQLTNAVRLYGTDCNQTEMVLAAIDHLGLNSSMKIWLGVWLENNATTNTRQLDQMYTLLNHYGSDHFAGVIVGNEVLYRKDMTETQLASVLEGVKSNLTDMKMDLPLATSDLGDDWTANLAEKVDVVMSNVHPFFGGVPAPQAASWTWQFWQDHDVILASKSSSSSSSDADAEASSASLASSSSSTGATQKKSIISEVGWPTAGGTNCASTSSSCTSSTGSVAGVAGLNVFLDDWVCASLSNGTQYFWFEAFDEPWKVQFDSKGRGWEDQWGLFTVDRALKDGVKLPDCGGRTV